MIEVDKINYIINKIPLTTTIIVEGKRDKKALERIGFKNIISISGKSNEKILEFLKKKKLKRIAILTDFDKEGKEKWKEFTKLFQKNGIKIDSFVRRAFNILRIQKIEELISIAKLIENEEYRLYKRSSTYKKRFNQTKFIRRRTAKKLNVKQ